jgi:hypothetical protein
MTKLLQYGINSVQNLIFENGMTFNAGKTVIIFFARRTVSINFNYILYNSLVLRSQCVKVLEDFWWAVNSVFITTLTTHFHKA